MVERVIYVRKRKLLWAVVRRGLLFSKILVQLSNPLPARDTQAYEDADHAVRLRAIEQQHPYSHPAMNHRLSQFIMPSSRADLELYCHRPQHSSPAFSFSISIPSIADCDRRLEFMQHISYTPNPNPKTHTYTQPSLAERSYPHPGQTRASARAQAAEWGDALEPG